MQLSLLVPSGMRSRTRTRIAVSGENTETLLRGWWWSGFWDDVNFRLLDEVLHQGAVFSSDEKSVQRQGNKV